MKIQNSHGYSLLVWTCLVTIVTSTEHPTHCDWQKSEDYHKDDKLRLIRKTKSMDQAAFFCSSSQQDLCCNRTFTQTMGRRMSRHIQQQYATQIQDNLHIFSYLKAEIIRSDPFLLASTPPKSLSPTLIRRHVQSLLTTQLDRLLTRHNPHSPASSLRSIPHFPPSTNTCFQELVNRTPQLIERYRLLISDLTDRLTRFVAIFEALKAVQDSLILSKGHDLISMTSTNQCFAQFFHLGYCPLCTNQKAVPPCADTCRSLLANSNCLPRSLLTTSSTLDDIIELFIATLKDIANRPLYSSNEILNFMRQTNKKERFSSGEISTQCKTQILAEIKELETKINILQRSNKSNIGLQNITKKLETVKKFQNNMTISICRKFFGSTSLRMANCWNTLSSNSNKISEFNNQTSSQQVAYFKKINSIIRWFRAVRSRSSRQTRFIRSSNNDPTPTPEYSYEDLLRLIAGPQPEDLPPDMEEGEGKQTLGSGDGRPRGWFNKERSVMIFPKGEEPKDLEKFLLKGRKQQSRKNSGTESSWKEQPRLTGTTVVPNTFKPSMRNRIVAGPTTSQRNKSSHIPSSYWLISLTLVLTSFLCSL